MAFRSTLDATGASSGPSWRHSNLHLASAFQPSPNEEYALDFDEVFARGRGSRIRTGRAITIIPCSPLSHITHAQRYGVGAVLVCSFVTTESNRMPVPSQRSTATGEGSCRIQTTPIESTSPKATKRDTQRNGFTTFVHSRFWTSRGSGWPI